VLEVGTFDAFYAFLAERRGKARVVAVDTSSASPRFAGGSGSTSSPGTESRAIAERLRSRVDYRRLDALNVERLRETFDVILCFGVLHRVEAPLTLLRVLARASRPPGGSSSRPMACAPGRTARACSCMSSADVYARDDAVYWGFSRSSPESSGPARGLRRFEPMDAPEIACHPRGSSARSRTTDQATRSRRSASSAAN
jgi:SAM-dependent methyltransferase